MEFQNKNFQDVKKIEIAVSSTGQVQWKIDSKLKGDERLIERVAGRTFRISGGGFWQVHKKAAEVLSAAVTDMAAAVGVDLEADNLDLYGGVGLFTGTIAAIGSPKGRKKSRCERLQLTCSAISGPGGERWASRAAPAQSDTIAPL